MVMREPGWRVSAHVCAAYAQITERRAKPDSHDRLGARDASAPSWPRVWSKRLIGRIVFAPSMVGS
jgi:hypothetical protein